MQQEQHGTTVQQTRAGQQAHRLSISFPEFVGLTALLMALTALSVDIMLPALSDLGTALGVASENDRQLVVIVYMAGFAAGKPLRLAG